MVALIVGLESPGSMVIALTGSLMLFVAMLATWIPALTASRADRPAPAVRVGGRSIHIAAKNGRASFSILIATGSVGMVVYIWDSCHSMEQRLRLD